MASGSSTKIETLNKENFDTWRIQARAVLIKNKLWSVVEKPLNLEKADEEKREKDLLAQSELVLLISPSELKQIKNCKTAHEIWTLLDFIYASKGPARKASLLKKLILSKMENGNIREHLNKFMDVVDKLQDMDICIHEDLLTVMMLYSLPPDYENFRVAIESRDTLPKPEELKVKILEESEARQFNNGSNTNTTNTKDEHEEETNFVKTCKFCKKKGHIISECRRLENKKKKETNEEIPKTSHTVCMHSKSKSSDDEKNTWILDSGCTSHMSHNRNYFENLDKSNFQLLRLASQDATADITGKVQVTIMLDANVRGKSKIQEVILTNTLYVPTLSSNLLSIGKATESGWTVLFTDKKATITHPEEGIILDAPKGKDGMYYLNPASCKYNNKDKCNLAEDTKIHTWHKCLGHMNEADMKLALKNETLIGLDFKSDEKLGDCEICIRAKIKRLPSKPNDTPRTTKRLEIVHSDVCGSMTQTLGGEKYFITFIDDYTRYSRVYCIKQKSDVLDKFKLYKAEMENFTGDKIISPQSDNGLEYCKPEPAQIPDEEQLGNRGYSSETGYDSSEIAETLRNGLHRLTVEQRAVFYRVCDSAVNNSGEMFFLDAPGGTGKTFLTKIILAQIRSQGKIALAVVSSGIAATLLPGGKTAHTMFKIPIQLETSETPVCDISRNSDKAQVLRGCSLIVWDECTMAHRKAVEAVNRTLQDVRRDDRPMGGISMLFCGDFRQILPVAPRGTRADEVNACLKSSSLWPHIIRLHLTTNMRAQTGGNSNAQEFSDLLLSIGKTHFQKKKEKLDFRLTYVKVFLLQRN